MDFYINYIIDAYQNFIFDICLQPKTFQTDRRTLVNYLRYKKKPKQNKYFFLNLDM